VADDRDLRDPERVEQRRGVRRQQVERAVAALPFAGNTAGAAIVLIPPLKLAEYASLRAELAVSPERMGEIVLDLRDRIILSGYGAMIPSL
jgi:hypothetical protein